MKLVDPLISLLHVNGTAYLPPLLTFLRGGMSDSEQNDYLFSGLEMTTSELTVGWFCEEPGSHEAHESLRRSHTQSQLSNPHRQRI